MRQVSNQLTLPAAILAGGRSSRLGPNKLMLGICGEPLIQHTLRRVRKASRVSSAYLITSPGAVWDIMSLSGADGMIVDEFMVGPLGAVLTALKRLGDCLIIAGDMPLIEPKVLDALINAYYEAGDKYVACVPKVGKFLEPLHAVYRSSFASILNAALECGTISIQKLLKVLARSGIVATIEFETLAADAGLSLGQARNSFSNINTWRDLELIARNLACVADEPNGHHQ